MVFISEKSIQTFVNQAKKETEQSRLELEQQFRNVTNLALQRMVLVTPVQTGRLVGSYSVSSASGGESNRETLDPTKQNILSLVAGDLMQVKILSDKTAAVHNSADYYSYVEPTQGLTNILVVTFKDELQATESA